MSKKKTVALPSMESEAYGKLKEDVHFTGYTFERACMSIEWLLDEERWRKCGSFSDVNEFLDSVSLDKFRPVAEARKRIAVRIKELQPKASNTAIAKTMGVGRRTIYRDLVPNGTLLSKKSNNNKVRSVPNGTSISGATAAKLVQQAAKRKQDKQNSEQRKLDQRVSFDGAVLGECKLFNCSMVDAEVPADSIDWVITDPPYPKEFVALYADLAQMAQKWLKPGGSLLAMAGEQHLPEVLAALTSAGLTYQWTLAYLTPGGQAAQIFPKRVNTFWKPILWFVKGEYQGSWIGDVVTSKVNDNDKRFHDWGQSESGFADIVERFARVGDTICDPFMGGGTTGVVALSRGMKFFGIENDAETFNIAKARLGAMSSKGEAAE